MLELRFACGHRSERNDRDDAAPQCPVCGEVRVARVFAPAPKFRGLCSGPTAEMQALPPRLVRFDGSLVKDEDHG